MNHFDALVTNLDSNDLIFLNALYENDSTSKFQSVDREWMLKQTKLTDYTVRKVSERLEILLFIEVVKSNRQYRYFLTDFGLAAINNITERVEA